LIEWADQFFPQHFSLPAADLAFRTKQMRKLEVKTCPFRNFPEPRGGRWGALHHRYERRAA
jgi:hypothetical protein